MRLRKGLVVGGVVAAAGVVAVIAVSTDGSGSRAEPAPPEAFTRGPYLTRVTETSARLRWRTSRPGEVRVVATAPDGRRVTAAPAGRLSGLTPDTRYTWVATVDGAEGARGTVTTAPRALTGRVTFVVFGDYGVGSDDQRAVAALGVAQEPRFLATTGDNSYLVAAPDLLDKNIFQPLRPLMAIAPNYGVVGDHDVVFPVGRDALVRALDWPGGGERYDLRYGPVQLVGLGLAATRGDVAFAARALARPGPAVRFVVVHQPPKEGNPILPVLARLRPAAVLSGHLHAYERRVRPEVPGVAFLTVGTGGAPASGNPAFTPRTADARVHILGYGLLRVDVDPGRVTYRFLDTTGRVRDRLSQVRR